MIQVAISSGMIAPRMQIVAMTKSSLTLIYTLKLITERVCKAEKPVFSGLWDYRAALSSGKRAGLFGRKRANIPGLSVTRSSGSRITEEACIACFRNYGRPLLSKKFTGTWNYFVAYPKGVFEVLLPTQYLSSFV